MRPGEILGLKWEHVNTDSIEIKQRLYRGAIDTPKTHFSVRSAAISSGLVHEIEEWRSFSPDPTPQSSVFPSENLRTPLLKDNCWRRHMLPKLKAVGLEWANFQVMRRTHASLLNELTGDPKLVADQRGQSVDVNPERLHTVGCGAAETNGRAIGIGADFAICSTNGVQEKWCAYN
jgi:integrase